MNLTSSSMPSPADFKATAFLDEQVLSCADYPTLEAFYQDLHAHPELSGEEQMTAEKILAELRALDATIHTGIGGHGIVAVFRNGEGPTALMRADFDALPVEEETGVAFTSTVPGKMHACGHDMHTTMLVGLCKIFDRNRHLWRGTFIALFQPAEETLQGARAMVEDGLAKLIPTPDVCFAQHIVAGRAGDVISTAGATLTGTDSVEIIVYGKSAHGSMPHAAQDPTFAAAAIIQRFQGIVGRELAPGDFGVISVGTVEAGNSHNTIPGQARIVANVRVYSEKNRELLRSAIERVVYAEAAASGLTAPPSIRYFNHAPVTENSQEVFNTIRPLFDAHFGPHSRTSSGETASEDFSLIPTAFNSPYFYWFIGATPAHLWDHAQSTGTVASTIPVNHMSTFLPDFFPTLYSGLRASALAVGHYLSASV
ncbi:MAG: amidohydrolase [Corynebacterium sp.]|uniref:amidohydrolase n=1 Tax=Corynebacterium sp. TaxID=1720 RepID=UPI0026DBF5CA|nr:amidohydrolase [Corynebacterium sp.]MDO4762073.1 amidohydrolase [Corynebacterium sp.]